MITCVIPARLKSTRLANKVLLKIGDKPMLEHVWNAANKVPFFDHVCFAIDAKETAQVIDEFGGTHYMTSPDCPSGTKRLIDLMKQKVVKSDIWVNWQADEPFISSDMIEILLSQVDTDQECDIWTLMTPIETREEANDPSAVKVVTDRFGKALYFSRASIPFLKGDGGYQHLMKHLGIYAYSTRALEHLDLLPPSPLERAEKLEQLTFLYNGLSMRVLRASRSTIGIDTREDLLLAEKFLAG